MKASKTTITKECNKYDDIDLMLFDFYMHYDLPEQEYHIYRIYNTLKKEASTASHRYKIRVNRIFREKAICTPLPFPEVDTLFERMRSCFIMKIRIYKKFFSLVIDK